MSSASVKINSSSKGFLAVLAKRSNTSQQDYLSSAIDYLYETGLDIYNKKSVNVGDGMKALENRLIGFLKKREQDFFVPMSQKMTALTKSNVDLLNGIETLDIIDFVTKKGTAEHKPEFKVSSTKSIVQNKDPNSEQLSKKTEVFELSQVHVDAEIQQKKVALFKDELAFLTTKIHKGSGLNSGKFIANITQRDMDRINRILNDN